MPDQCIQKFLHAFCTQGRTEEAGEEGLFSDQFGNVTLGYAAGLQILLQNCLIAQGDGFFIFKRCTISAELCFCLCEQMGSIGFGQVHLIKKEKGWHMVMPQELPKCAGMRLNAVTAVDE